MTPNDTDHHEPPVARTWEEGLDLVLAHLRRTMIDRQRKYGPGNISRYGGLGCRIRAADKLARLDNAHTIDFPDESVDDAYTDLANYGGVIPLMLRWGFWGLPEARDVST